MTSSMVSGGMSSSMIPSSISTLGGTSHGISTHGYTTNYSSGINSLGLITSSTSSYALADSAYSTGGTISTSGVGGVGTLGMTGSNVSPLPIRSNLASTMPPLCQVLDILLN
jgi:hypothetical protein